MGYFRDDGPLCDMILDDGQRAELDSCGRSWISSPMCRCGRCRAFYGSSEPIRASCAMGVRSVPRRGQGRRHPAKIARLAEVYLAKARDNGGGEVELQAIADYFREMIERSRRVEQARLAAEPSHWIRCSHLPSGHIAGRCSAAERDDIAGFLSLAARNEESTHEEAMQDAVV